MTTGVPVRFPARFPASRRPVRAAPAARPEATSSLLTSKGRGVTFSVFPCPPRGLIRILTFASLKTLPAAKAGRLRRLARRRGRPESARKNTRKNTRLGKGA